MSFFALSAIASAIQPGWVPADLFKNGEQGAWYDPSDLTTLYQDAAGTTPVTADGDPVGLMLDKSGNGNHASQSTAASRPIYRTDGALHWLEGDGVDDFLETGIWSLSENWFVSYGVSQNVYANYHGPWRFLREGGAPTAISTNRLEDYTRDSRDRVVISRYQSVGPYIDRKSVLPSVGTRYVGWAGYNPDATYHVGEQWDGVEQNIAAPDLSRSIGTGSLSLFRAYSGDFMPGKLFGFVFKTTSPVNDEERNLINSYMRGKAGVTL